MRLTTPRFSGRELSTAITILSARYRPLGSCSRAAGWSAATLCFDPNRTLRAPRQDLWYPPSNRMGRFNEAADPQMALAARAERPRVLRLHTDLKLALPGLEEDQRREAGLRPHRLRRDGLHWPSHRRISGDVQSRRRCSVLGDRGTLDRQAPEGACRHRRTGRFAFG